MTAEFSGEALWRAQGRSTRRSTACTHSGNAVATIDHYDHYLGKHGAPESLSAYDKLIADWLARGGMPS